MRLLRIHLQTARLDELASFYGVTLGLPVERAVGSITIHAGATTLVFLDADAGTDPFYHFAFNITASKMPEARRWLADRSPLLLDSESGDAELHFETWNADSIYFHDPAGSIVEMIARHGLAGGASGAPVTPGAPGPPGPFGPADLLCVSEIGLPLRDPATTVPHIVETLDLPRYLGSSFALGDEEGLLILPEEGRPWIPERAKPACIFPARVTMAGADARRLAFGDLPYEFTLI